MKRFTRKRIAILAVAVLAIVMTTVAWAYFAGSGSASKPVKGGSAPQLTVTIPNAIDDLYPDAPVDVSVHIVNNTQGSVRAGTLVGDSPLITGLPVGCDASWFYFEPQTIGITLASGAQTDALTSLTLQESGTDQSSCEDANLTLHVKVIPGG